MRTKSPSSRDVLTPSQLGIYTWTTQATLGLLIPSFFPSRRRKTTQIQFGPSHPGTTRHEALSSEHLMFISIPHPHEEGGPFPLHPMDLRCRLRQLLLPPTSAPTCPIPTLVRHAPKPVNILDLAKILAKLDRTRQPPEAQAPAAQKHPRHLLPSRRSDARPPKTPRKRTPRWSRWMFCKAGPQRLLGHPPCNQPKHISPVAECCLTTLAYRLGGSW